MAVSIGRAGARARLVAMLVLGIIAGVATAVLGDPRLAGIVGWDTAALVFSGGVWAAIGRMGSGRTESHATAENPGRAISDVIVLAAAVVSLVAVGLLLAQAKSASSDTTKDLLSLLGLFSIALSWAAVHTLFTLRYARLYYAGPNGGIDFNQKAPPRYLDFAYLAFTIGMTFQVSDTDLQTPAIRATALRHALLSYLFGAVILASSINLIASISG
jgi:uncharacterized membrane protein